MTHKEVIVSHSYLIVYYINRVFICLEQQSVQMASDTLTEKLWNQVEALKTGQTGSMKMKA